MYQSILLPTDGSDATRQAIRHAFEFADRYDAALHVLSVVSGDQYRTPDGRDEATDEALRAVDAVATRAEGDDVGVTREVRYGVPHEQILAYADEADVDMVVMGTHGRTGFGRAVLGSVTERVVRSSEVPVVTVRATQDLSITDPETARELAGEELRRQGYDDLEVTDDPYRTSGSWIVPCSDGTETVHAHVEADSGTVRLAHIGDGD